MLRTKHFTAIQSGQCHQLCNFNCSVFEILAEKWIIMFPWCYLVMNNAVQLFNTVVTMPEVKMESSQQLTSFKYGHFTCKT